MKCLNWLWKFLMDERGEDDPSGAGAGADAPADAGGGDAPPANQDGQPDGDGGTGDEPPATTPKYGEFGDAPTPDQIFEAYNKNKTEYDNFRKKAGQTEQNLAKTRQFLQSVGLVQQSDGSWAMPAKREGQERKTRFTDDHKKLFHPTVIPAMQAFVADMIDEAFSGYGRQQSEQQQWITTLHKSIDKMYKLYPVLNAEINGQPNPQFNKAFADRATEILNESYRDLPNGDLLAAHEAAIELGISPIVVEKAKKEAAAAATGNKRILGPVGSGGKGGGAGRRLSKEEYLKLSPEEKETYDKSQMLK